MIFCGLPVISVASSLSFSFWAGGYPRTRWPAMTTCDWVRFYGLRIIMWCVGALPFVGTLLSWAARTSILQGSAAQLHHTDTKQKASNNVSKPLLRESAGSATCPVTGSIRKRHNRGGSICTAGFVDPNAIDPSAIRSIRDSIHPQTIHPQYDPPADDPSATMGGTPRAARNGQIL